MKIVVLHGWGEQAPFKIQALVHSLRSKGHEVFAPHMPGFGSMRTPREAWSVSDYSQWVIDELHQKGWQQVVLCGHSFGGRVSLKLAAEHPEMVSHLILISSAGIKHKLGFKARLVQTVSSMGKRIFSFPLFSIFEPVCHTFWRKLLGRQDYYRASGIMQKTFVAVIAEDLRELADHIASPTLILWGKKDNLVPVEDAYYFHEKIANSKMKIYATGDHLIPYNYPDEIAEEVDMFIQQ